VSRSRLPWGIPFPDTDDETVYVWFDALINYLSGTGFPDPDFERLWPADLHVIGKGITRFHCIIWPAMLLAAELPLPRMVWAHGYVQWGGAKVSKSEGASVSLDEAAERHGADALRWFLMREVGFESDGDFTFERFDAVYESELANGLGNLASRTLAMIEKYRDGVVPTADLTDADRTALSLTSGYVEAMTRIDLKGAAHAVMRLVEHANATIQAAAPWALAKDPARAAELDQVLAFGARTLLRLALMCEPLMPGKARELWDALGRTEPIDRNWAMVSLPEMGGRTVRKPGNLFPKRP
jgi:methionyl-tRNA synthetase